MLRLKAIILIAIFTALLTGCAIYLAHDASVMTPNTLEVEHFNLQGIVSNKLAQAETSLLRQADRVATDAKLVQELGVVREKLLTTAPEELRKTMSKAWNGGVFSALLVLAQQMASDLREHGARMGDLVRAESGDMHTLIPDDAWWGAPPSPGIRLTHHDDAPGLLLAFASVPMKDGTVSQMLIAQGLQGKELLGGKGFEQSIPVLGEVASDSNPKPRIAHFPWDGKMYVAAVAPVVQDGKVIGTVVIGNELSRDLALRLGFDLPEGVGLTVAYAAPGFGEKPADVHAEFSELPPNDPYLDALLGAEFHAVDSAGGHAQSNAVRYHAIDPRSVYIATLRTADGDTDEVAMSRVRWFWSRTEETDILITTPTHEGVRVVAALKRNMIIAAIALFALACLIALLFIRYMQRDRRRIRMAFAESMASGDPVDPEALALLLGERPESLAPYVLRRADDDDGDGGWDSLMDDATDDAQNGADASENGADANPSETAALYEEYMRLRRENHIDAPMTYEEFLRKLETSTNRIIEKYHCEKVSFLVHVNNGNVVLKPKIVRK